MSGEKLTLSLGIFLQIFLWWDVSEGKGVKQKRVGKNGKQNRSKANRGGGRLSEEIVISRIVL